MSTARPLSMQASSSRSQDASTRAAQPPARQLVRLTHDAKAFLQDMFSKNPYPNGDFIKEYTAKLKADYAGNDLVTKDTVSRWFIRKRKERREREAQGETPLTLTQRDHLAGLVNNAKIISDDVIRNWASILLAPVNEVRKFVEARLQNQYRPPTPPSTTSPEPQPSVPDFVQVKTPVSPDIPPASLPPLLSRAYASAAAPRARSPISSPSNRESAHILIPFQNSPPQSPQQPPPPLSSHAVTQKLLKPAAKLKTRAGADMHPRTAGEFNQCFGPDREPRMRDFVDRIRDGSLQNWGFHPSMAGP